VTTVLAVCPYTLIMPSLNLFCTWRWRQNNPLKYSYAVIRLHGVCHKPQYCNLDCTAKWLWNTALCSWRTSSYSNIQAIPHILRKYKCSLPCPQQTATCPYNEPD
jgi:hypothetical protein